MNWKDDNNSYPKYIGSFNGRDIIANDEKHHSELTEEFFPEKKKVDPSPVDPVPVQSPTKPVETVNQFKPNQNYGNYGKRK
jgi:hypothetical protein